MGKRQKKAGKRNVSKTDAVCSDQIRGVNRLNPNQINYHEKLFGNNNKQTIMR